MTSSDTSHEATRPAPLEWTEDEWFYIARGGVDNFCIFQCGERWEVLHGDTSAGHAETLEAAKVLAESLHARHFDEWLSLSAETKAAKVSAIRYCDNQAEAIRLADIEPGGGVYPCVVRWDSFTAYAVAPKGVPMEIITAFVRNEVEKSGLSADKDWER